MGFGVAIACFVYAVGLFYAAVRSKGALRAFLFVFCLLNAVAGVKMIDDHFIFALRPAPYGWDSVDD